MIFEITMIALAANCFGDEFYQHKSLKQVKVSIF